MKKIYFLFMAVACASVFFDSCSTGEDTDEVSFYFPQYEAADFAGGDFPCLTGWNVVSVCGDERVHKTVPAQEKAVSFVLEKNSPCAVLAFPVILCADREIEFFKPAGCIYPEQRSLSFLHGFSASVLDEFYSHAVLSSTSSEKAVSYARRFNWKKFISVIEQKNDLPSPELLYNAWLLEKSTVLEGIAAGSFSATYLGMKNVRAVSEAEIRTAIEKKSLILENSFNVPPDADFAFFSSYWPFNNQKGEKSFSVKYGVQEEFLCVFSGIQTVRAFISVSKDGKITLALNSIPI